MDGADPVIMLRGGKIGLGPIRRDLVKTYQRWFNELAVTRTLAIPNMPMTRTAEEQWLEQALTSRTSAIFTIYELESLLPIGNTSLDVIDLDHRTANYGIVIGDSSAWNKGYGTDTTHLMLQYAFDVLGLHNVMLEAYSHNPWAIRAYERAGFRKIGIRRNAVQVGRERHDAILMDATVDDMAPSQLHDLIQSGQLHPPAEQAR